MASAVGECHRSNQITCIATGGEWVWFGTFDAGLARYNKQTQEWTQFTEDDGLAHNSVLSMALDDGTIWVGTRRGLSRYEPRTQGWTIYREH